MAGELSIHLDGPELQRLLKAFAEQDRKVMLATKRAIRDAAKPAAEDVKRTVLSAPGSGRTGLRAGIAAGVGIRINQGGSKGASVRIVATPNRLPANRAPMVKAFNQKSFRHPVFGNRFRWVRQEGRPYFGDVIYAHRGAIRTAIVRAVEQAQTDLRNAN